MTIGFECTTIPTYLCLLFGALLILLLSLLNRLVVVTRLQERGQECVENSKELIWLDQGTVLTKQPDGTVKSK